MKMPWFHDRDGRTDPVLTFATFALGTVLFKMFFAGASVSWTLAAGKTLAFAIVAPDAASIGAVLLPTLGAYVSNRYVNYQYHPDYVRMKKDIDGDGKEEEVLVVKKGDDK